MMIDARQFKDFGFQVIEDFTDFFKIPHLKQCVAADNIRISIDGITLKP